MIDAADTNTRMAIDRTRLSYDRTMLSWIRTATSLITFGFSVEKFSQLIRADRPPENFLLSARGVGIMMVSIGVLALAFATLDHLKAINHLKREYPAEAGYIEMPRSHARQLAALLAVLGVAAIISGFLRG